MNTYMLRRGIVALLLSVVLISSTWSLLVPSAFPLHDFTHVARFSQMSDALTDGQFPVRWVADFGYGYGMPLYEFYAPLPYYIGGLLFTMGLHSFIAVKVMYVLVSLLTIIGGYKLGKILYGTSGGVLVSAAVTLAPYRALNLFIRGALSESFGIMAIVWIIFATGQYIKTKTPLSFLQLVFWVAVLFLSHNLITLLSVPFLVLLAMGLSLQTTLVSSLEKRQLVLGHLKSDLKVFFEVVAAYALSACISAFYLIPSFFEKDFTRVSTQVITDYFNYSLHFLYLRQFITPFWGYGGSQWGPDDPLSFFLGWGQLLGAALAFYWAFKFIKSPKTHVQLSAIFKLVVFGTLFVFSILLSTEKSQLLWQYMPLMKFIQFPWRFLSLSSIFLAILVAGFIPLMNRVQRLIIFGTIFILLLGNAAYFKPEKYLDAEQALYYDDKQRIRSEMSGILPDYIPVQMDIKALEVNPSDGQLLFCKDGESCIKYDELVNRSHEKLIRVTLDEPSALVWSISDYPGWNVQIDGAQTNKYRSEDGFVAVNVPKGTHILGVQLGGTPLRNASDIVSLLACIVFAVIYVRTQHEAA